MKLEDCFQFQFPSQKGLGKAQKTWQRMTDTWDAFVQQPVEGIRIPRPGTQTTKLHTMQISDTATGSWDEYCTTRTQKFCKLTMFRTAVLLPETQTPLSTV